MRAAARRLGPLDTELARRWQARLTAFEAVVRQGQELPEEALVVARRAVEQASEAGERFALAQAYAATDWALIVLGRADEAVFMAKALAIYEELGDLPRQAAALNNLGAAAYFEGRWDVAGDFYDRAREASRRSGNEALAAVAAMNQGEILVNQGRLDEAESVLLEARRVLRATGSEAAQFTDLQLGRVAIERGDLAEAERFLTHAQQDAAAVGRHGSALEAAIHLSRCHLLRDDPAAALETLRTGAAGRQGGRRAVRRPGGGGRDDDPGEARALRSGAGRQRGRGRRGAPAEPGLRAGAPAVGLGRCGRALGGRRQLRPAR